MLLNPNGYTGNDACAVCHEQEAATWSFTSHARAYDTLVTHGADRNGECVSCHVVDDGDIAYDDNFEAALTSGAAPNLTHFATRASFAGATHNQYLGPGTDPDDDALDASQYVQLSELAADAANPDGYRWNTAELKRWVADASAQKDMAPDELRGMPSFPQLTDQDLDDVVAYLATLD